jgi:hypothetical protein
MANAECRMPKKMPNAEMHSALALSDIDVFAIWHSAFAIDGMSKLTQAL